MFLLKFDIRSRRIVGVVMIVAVMQAGLPGSVVPVLAQAAETTRDAVYQSTPPSSGVAEDVYGTDEQKPNLPFPRTFLKETLLKPLTAPEGKFTVSGQVTENSTGMPLSGVTVQMLLDGHPTQFETSTDDKGSYNLTGVGSGQYLLTFQSPGCAPETFGIKVDESDIKQDCGLFRNTSVKGHVVNQDGNSLDGVQVNLLDQNIPDRDIQLVTNEDGWFNLTEVPPGRYRLSVSQSVYRKQKTVWVDEYPQEFTIILPISVSDAVYGETPPKDKDDHEHPTVDEEVYGDSSDDSGGSNEPPGEGEAEQGRIAPKDVSPVGFNIASISSGSQKKPTKLNLTWYPEFHALKGPSPLAELEQLLKQQTTMD